MLENLQQYIGHQVLVKRGSYEVKGYCRTVENSPLSANIIVGLSSVIECLTDEWIGNVDIVWQKEYTIGIIG